MSMSVVPRPFHNCRKFIASNLVTIDGVPLPLAEIGRRRSVVLAALDLDMSTPSAGQILSQLLLPVYGRPRQGSTGVSDGSGGDISTTEDLHELLLCCDAYIIILAKEPLHQCRELQRELAVAGESFAHSGSVSPASRGSTSLRLGTSALDGAHLLPGCLSIVHDEGAELLKSLQLVGLDGRTVPAVFKIASNDRLQLQERQFDQPELALHYRQFGLAYAGVQHSLEYALVPPETWICCLSLPRAHVVRHRQQSSEQMHLVSMRTCANLRCRHQLLVERAATERFSQHLLTTVVRPTYPALLQGKRVKNDRGVQERLVVTFKRLKLASEPEPEPELAARTAPEVAVPTAPAATDLLDTLPPPILEHILSQLLHACNSPGAVCICDAYLRVF